MAWQTKGAGSGYWLTVMLTDTQGDISNKEYELRAVDMATAETDALAIVAGLVAVTDSVATSYHVAIRRYEDTFAYPAGADNSVLARLSLSLSTVAKKASIDIPAPVIGLFASASGPNNNVIDVDDADLITYVNLFDTGNEAFISDGEDVGNILKGARVTRKKGFKS